MTHETRIKDAVNMEDLICLLATVRTLNSDKSFIPSKRIISYGENPRSCSVYSYQSKLIMRITENCVSMVSRPIAFIMCVGIWKVLIDLLIPIYRAISNKDDL